MLGEELCAARLRANRTQEDLAHAANVDRSHLSELDYNQRSPTVDTFLRLCKAMNAAGSRIIARVEQTEQQTQPGGAQS